MGKSFTLLFSLLARETWDYFTVRFN